MIARVTTMVFPLDRPNLGSSMDGVFAAGDRRSGGTRQVAIAVGEGATATCLVREHIEHCGEAAHTPG